MQRVQTFATRVVWCACALAKLAKSQEVLWEKQNFVNKCENTTKQVTFIFLTKRKTTFILFYFISRAAEGARSLARQTHRLQAKNALSILGRALWSQPYCFRQSWPKARGEMKGIRGISQLSVRTRAMCPTCLCVGTFAHRAVGCVC